MQGGVLRQNTTQKVYFSLSLLPPLPQPFTAKGCAGDRRGDSSGFTVTVTCTWRLGGKKERVAVCLTVTHLIIEKITRCL
jgi:hypothetical protein